MLTTVIKIGSQKNQIGPQIFQIELTDTRCKITMLTVEITDKLKHFSKELKE